MGGHRGFGYDLAGRTATATTADSSLQLSYDDRGLLSAVSGSAGSSSFLYDAAGRMTRRTDAAGTVNYSWTARNELFGLSDTLTGQSRTYTRSDAGDLVNVNYGNMTVRDYTYDPIGRLDTDRVHNWVGNVWTADYDYDVNGNLITEAVGPADVAGAGTHAYTYDAADRLTGWTGPGALPGGTTYAYDAAGNRVTAGNTAYTYDARNRMLTEGATTYAWTPRGDLAAKTTGGTTTAFSYDGLGQQTAAGNIGYRYDALGRVIVRGANAFAYSGLDPQTVLDGTSYVVHSPSGDPVATGDWIVGGRHVIADRHGDAVAAVKPDGSLLGSVAYDPAGAVTAQTGTTMSVVGYQGAYTDPATGLVDLGARWYQPGSSSFTTRDTDAGQPTDPATLNRYAYANDNPLSHTDPDGHKAKPIGKSFGKSGGKGAVNTTKSTASTKKTVPAPKATTSQKQMATSEKRTAAPAKQSAPKQLAAQPAKAQPSKTPISSKPDLRPVAAPAAHASPAGKNFTLLSQGPPTSTKTTANVKGRVNPKQLADPGSFANPLKSYASRETQPPMFGLMRQGKAALGKYMSGPGDEGPLNGPGQRTPEELFEMLPERYKDIWEASVGHAQQNVTLGGVPIQQIAYCLDLGNLFNCNKSLVIRERVLDSPWSAGDNSQYNAYQHIMLSALLTVYLGEDEAREILDAHEGIEDGVAMAPWDPARMMDIINNEIGIQMGLALDSDYSDEPYVGLELDLRLLPQVHQMTVDAIDSGQAVWFEDPTNPPPL